MLGAAGVGGDKRQIDLRLDGTGEFTLGLLCRFIEPLEGLRIAAQFDPRVFLELASQSTRRLSKSLPPRWVSPLVARTSQMPSPTSRMDTSKVPPPRSKTMIV